MVSYGLTAPTLVAFTAIDTDKAHLHGHSQRVFPLQSNFTAGNTAKAHLTVHFPTCTVCRSVATIWRCCLLFFALSWWWPCGMLLTRHFSTLYYFSTQSKFCVVSCFLSIHLVKHCSSKHILHAPVLSLLLHLTFPS